jgi:hypothetical protein
MWIHHFVILQLFHPLFRFYRGEETNEIVFLNENHNLFVAKMNDDQMKLYNKTHNGNPKFSWLWLGRSTKSISVRKKIPLSPQVHTADIPRDLRAHMDKSAYI